MNMLRYCYLTIPYFSSIISHPKGTAASCRLSGMFPPLFSRARQRTKCSLGLFCTCMATKKANDHLSDSAFAFFLRIQLFFRCEIFFTNTTQRAFPVFRQIFESCSRLDTVVRITYFWIINVAACFAYRLLDNCMPPWKFNDKSKRHY